MAHYHRRVILPPAVGTANGRRRVCHKVVEVEEVSSDILVTFCLSQSWQLLYSVMHKELVPRGTAPDSSDCALDHPQWPASWQ